MAQDYLKALSDKEARKTGDRYGISHSDYGFNRPGAGGIQKKNPQDYGKDVASAAMNDYDTRRTIEAAAMSGKKKAQQYAENGFSDLTDVTKANNMFAKMHKRQGNGGSFSSNSDYAGLTYGMVQRDRNKLTDSMTANEQQAQAEEGTSEPATPSKEMSEARERVENFDNKDYGVYGNSEAGDNEDQRNNAANSFLDKYKLDVKSGANFQPTI